ncbi:hypothetical protein ACH46F_32680 [Streptomyces virginiae]|uniref:hypothetical protein n=1 Tax=Streptomyces virginiae TaxID=1961 RepID=UPI0037B8303F
MTTTYARVPVNWTQEPPHLPLRTEPDPVPTPGCGVCEALGRQRAEARAKGDRSKVSDCNVELRNHQRGKRV